MEAKSKKLQLLEGKLRKMVREELMTESNPPKEFDALVKSLVHSMGYARTCHNLLKNSDAGIWPGEEDDTVSDLLIKIWRVFFTGSTYDSSADDELLKRIK